MDRIPEWMRKKMGVRDSGLGVRDSGLETPEAYEEFLRSKIAAGEITVDEAEHEWNDRFNPESRCCGQEW